MKILIDIRIVKIFRDLPDTFKLRELLTIAKISLSEEKTIHDSLTRMEELGILHRAESNRKWHKEYGNLNFWFSKYLTEIENSAIQK